MKDLTIKEFADHFGYGVSTVRLWLKDKKDLPHGAIATQVGGHRTSWSISCDLTNAISSNKHTNIITEKERLIETQKRNLDEKTEELSLTNQQLDIAMNENATLKATVISHERLINVLENQVASLHTQLDKSNDVQQNQLQLMQKSQQELHQIILANNLQLDFKKMSMWRRIKLAVFGTTEENEQVI